MNISAKSGPNSEKVWYVNLGPLGHWFVKKPNVWKSHAIVPLISDIIPDTDIVVSLSDIYQLSRYRGSLKDKERNALPYIVISIQTLLGQFCPMPWVKGLKDKERNAWPYSFQHCWGSVEELQVERVRPQAQHHHPSQLLPLWGRQLLRLHQCKQSTLQSTLQIFVILSIEF